MISRGPFQTQQFCDSVNVRTGFSSNKSTSKATSTHSTSNTCSQFKHYPISDFKCSLILSKSTSSLSKINQQHHYQGINICFLILFFQNSRASPPPSPCPTEGTEHREQREVNSTLPRSTTNQFDPTRASPSCRERKQQP